MATARPETRREARELRRKGWSIKRIAKEVEAAVSSVSFWTRDIELTPEQREKLHQRPPGMPKAAGEARKRKMRADIDQAEQDARETWDRLQDDRLFLFGIALYIAEGRKGTDGLVAVANTDPRVLRAVKAFFLKIGIENADLRAHAQVPKGGSDPDDALVHWAGELGIGWNRFNKVTVVPRRKNGNKYPFGTCTLKVSNIHIKRRVNVWMDLALGPFSAETGSVG